MNISKYHFIVAATVTFVAVLILYAPKEPKEPSEMFKMVETQNGILCVIWEKSVSCNWDEYNFRRWHETVPQSPHRILPHNKEDTVSLL